MKYINEAGWERAARVALGVLLLVLGWGGAVGGVVGTLFKIIGFVPLLTGLSGWCPIYSVLHFRTNKAPDAA